MVPALGSRLCSVPGKTGEGEFVLWWGVENGVEESKEDDITSCLKRSAKASLRLLFWRWKLWYIRLRSIRIGHESQESLWLSCGRSPGMTSPDSIQDGIKVESRLPKDIITL